jgi:hypothetical protein
MNGLAKMVAVLMLGSAVALAAETPVIEAVHAAKDVTFETDPASPFWNEAHPIYMDKDRYSKSIPGYRSEVRTRWTKDNLYFLFTCPYEQLYLKPEPNTQQETNELWNWDVAEVFLGSDFRDIKRYKEFEVSPQGEGIDLDVDRHKLHHEDGWTWNSGVEVAVRTDAASHRWYAAMRIPYSAVDTRAAAPGNILRINLFRSQGPPAHRRQVTWQPPMSNTFHVPERFGVLKLVRGRQ